MQARVSESEREGEMGESKREAGKGEQEVSEKSAKDSESDRK